MGSKRRLAALWALALVCAGGLIATYLVFVRTYHGQKLDQGAFEGRALAGGRAREAGAHLLTTISATTLALALLVLVAQALVRRRLALSFIAGTVIVGSLVTTETLKHGVLMRPDLLAGSLYENTFPSGHVTVAFSVGVAAVLVVPTSLRRWTAGLAVLYGTAIGIAVIASGWHRPSDVAGAYLVVIGWAAAVVAAAALLDDDAFLPHERSWTRGSVAWHYLALGIGLPLAGLVAAVGLAFAIESGRIAWTIVDAAFLAACAGLAGLAAIAMAALLATVGWALPPPQSSRYEY